MDPDFDPPSTFRTSLDRLHATVARRAGTDDFGPVDYLPGLKVLLQSMDYDPQFTEFGRRNAWRTLIDVLHGRVDAIKSMKESSGFDAHPILSPVVITGVPRTGTTALHRLMTVDKRFQGLQTWLLDSPMPRPPIESWQNYPQFRKSVADLKAHEAIAPDSFAAHFRAAEEVHECCMILRQSFISNTWNCAWSAPTYDAWWQAQCEYPAYQHYYRCVQLIGSNEPEKRWLLKNPGHIENLDLLFAIYPDARVIWTHRDPAKAIPSLVSLLMLLSPANEVGRIQQRGEIMLQREVAKWANAIRKAEEVRKRFPDQVLDVIHGNFHREPMKVIEQIYQFIHMDIPDAVRHALSKRIVEKPELARGQHRYSIADYGMREEEARAPFGDYVHRYELD